MKGGRESFGRVSALSSKKKLHISLFSIAHGGHRRHSLVIYFPIFRVRESNSEASHDLPCPIIAYATESSVLILVTKKSMNPLLRTQWCCASEDSQI